MIISLLFPHYQMYIPITYPNTRRDDVYENNIFIRTPSYVKSNDYPYLLCDRNFHYKIVEKYFARCCSKMNKYSFHVRYESGCLNITIDDFYGLYMTKIQTIKLKRCYKKLIKRINKESFIDLFIEWIIIIYINNGFNNIDIMPLMKNINYYIYVICAKESMKIFCSNNDIVCKECKKSYMDKKKSKKDIIKNISIICSMEEIYTKLKIKYPNFNRNITYDCKKHISKEAFELPRPRVNIGSLSNYYGMQYVFDNPRK